MWCAQFSQELYTYFITQGNEQDPFTNIITHSPTVAQTLATISADQANQDYNALGNDVAILVQILTGSADFPTVAVDPTTVQLIQSIVVQAQSLTQQVQTVGSSDPQQSLIAAVQYFAQVDQALQTISSQIQTSIDFNTDLTYVQSFLTTLSQIIPAN